MKYGISRRNFLLQAGGAVLTLPLLPSLLPQALAADGKPPKRFITICHRYGHHIRDFFPTVQADIKVSENVFYKKLTEIPGVMSPILNAKFDAYRAKMNILQGLDSIGGAGHNATIPLTGASVLNGESETSGPTYGKSIDALMAKSLNVYSTTPRFNAIRINNSYFGTSGISWDRDANGNPFSLSYMNGDQAVFNALFGGNTSSGQTQLNRHKLIVDQVKQRYQALKSNVRMSTLDRQRLEQHVTTVTEVQKRLISSTPGSCTAPGFTPYVNNKVTRELLWRNQIDCMVSAMACDMSRIGVLFVADYKTGLEDQNYAESHGNSHDRENTDTGRAQALNFSLFKADQVLYLLQRLSSIIEADGSTMLDNTVVLWTAELSSGNHHRAECLPAVTFGSCGGALNTGYLMDFRLKPLQYLAGRSDFHTPIGQSYNRLLITLMRAMGLQASEYINEGDGGGFGEFKKSITYLTDQYTRYISQRNDPLPIIFKT